MAFAHQVLLSAPYPKNLSEAQRTFVGALTQQVEEQGFSIYDLDKLARLDSYSNSVRHLHGVIVVAVAQWQARRTACKQDEATLSSEFAHLDIAISTAANRPLLVLKEKSVADRGALKSRLGARVVLLPSSLRLNWLTSEDFLAPFGRWASEVKAQRDVFLGYCSKSRGLAAQVQLQLERAGLSVHDWTFDFQLGSTILTQLEEARSRCTSGVFLFTEDDPLEGHEAGAAPRDNVIFEAGWLLHERERPRALPHNSRRARQNASRPWRCNLRRLRSWTRHHVHSFPTDGIL